MYESLLTFPGGVFSEFERLRRQMDDVFGSSACRRASARWRRAAIPAVNVGTTPLEHRGLRLCAWA